MTSLLLSFLLWLINQGSPEQIPERNQAKQSARDAFRRGAYRQAAQTYEALSQTRFFPELPVLLNLAHCYFLLRDTTRAEQTYARLLRVPDSRVASTAWAQTGLLQTQRGDTAVALTSLRQALALFPDNEVARYNYELLRLRYRPRATPPPPRPDAPPRTAPPPEQREVEQSEQRRQTLERLRRYDLSEEQAQQLLDALNATELQYIQQQRRPAAGAPPPENPW